MFYKLRDFISRKLYNLAYFIDPVPTLEEVLGDPLSDYDWTEKDEDDDEIEW